MVLEWQRCGVNMLKSTALRSACSVFGVIRAGGIYGHLCNVRTFVMMSVGLLCCPERWWEMVQYVVWSLFDLVKKPFTFSFEFLFCRSVGHRSARVAQAINSLSVTIGVQTCICVVSANECLCCKCCRLCGLMGIMTENMKCTGNVGFEGASLHYSCTEL